MVPEREQHIIQSPKPMITVARNLTECHVLAALLNGTKFPPAIIRAKSSNRLENGGTHGELEN
jgi:hypothetical protein